MRKGVGGVIVCLSRGGCEEEELCEEKEAYMISNSQGETEVS